MAGTSRFPKSAITERWNAIVSSPDRYSPENNALSRELVNDCFDGENWVCGLWEAELVCNLAMDLSFSQEDYIRAEHLGRTLYLRPDTDLIDPITDYTVFLRIGFAIYWQGRSSDAVSFIQQEMNRLSGSDAARSDSRITKNMICDLRNLLLWPFEANPPDELADPGLRELALLVVNALTNPETLPQELLAGSTNSDLAVLIHATYPQYAPSRIRPQ